MHLEELAVVDDGFDNALHIVRLVGVLGDNAVEAVLQTVDRILGRNIGSLLEVVGGDVAHQVADKLDGLLLGLADEMGHTALGGMHHGAAQLIDGHILAGDGLHHLGAGKEHVAVLFGHEDEVGECGAVDSTTGTGAEDGADLRDDTAGQDIALENLGIACEGVAALLDTCSAGVVKADDRGTRLHGLVHNLADFEGHGLAQAAGENGEVLCKHINRTTVDGAVAGHHTVAQEGLLLHVEIYTAVSDKHVELLKRSFVQQESDTLAGSEFALFVLFVDTFLAAAHFGLASLVEKLFYLFFKCHI